jgi:hypothetical protein
MAQDIWPKTNAKSTVLTEQKSYLFVDNLV